MAKTIPQAWAPVKQTATTLAENFGKSFGSLGESLSGVVSGSSRIGRATVWTVSRPIVWLSHGVNIPLKIVNAAFSRAPVLAAGATVLGGGMLVGKIVRHHREASTQADLMNQMAYTQQLQAAAQRGGQISSDDPDLARMNSLMRDSSANPEQAASFAARVRPAAAPETSATPVDTTTVASL